MSTANDEPCASLPGLDSPSSTDRVRLVLPARPDLWILARLTASAIASRLDFSVVEVEDVRLAIDELCTLCADGLDSSGQVELTLCWSAEALEVSCDAVPGERERAEVSGVSAAARLELSARILSALVDSHEISTDADGRRHGSFLKQSAN